jgi:hypothetical protein
MANASRIAKNLQSQRQGRGLGPKTHRTGPGFPTGNRSGHIDNDGGHIDASG